MASFEEWPVFLILSKDGSPEGLEVSRPSANGCCRSLSAVHLLDAGRNQLEISITQAGA